MNSQARLTDQISGGILKLWVCKI